MKRRLFLLAALVALAGVALGLWWRGPGAVRRTLARYPRVVLVSLDTLHVDYTGVINPQGASTPELERLAATGTVMVQAHTTAPITLPSHTSLMSGRTPLSLGLLRNGDRVGDGVETLAERLRDAGYRTGAFLSLATLRREFALDRGFDTYDDGHGTVPRFYRTADEVYDAASAWLADAADRPFFLWVHLSDAHEPYAQIDAPPDTVVDLEGEELGRYALVRKERHELTVALPPGRHRLRWTSLRAPRPDDLPETSLRLHFPNREALASVTGNGSPIPSPDVGLEEPFVLELDNPTDATREVTLRFDGAVRKPPPSEVIENYIAEVALVDRTVGRLREAVEADGDEVLWIVVSDHGEGVYRRGTLIGHAGFGLEDQLRILWFMAGPGVPAGLRLESEPALMHDVAPTVLELLGLPALESVEGMSFVPCWRRGVCPRERRWTAHGFNRPLDEVSAVAVYEWPLKILEQRGEGGGVYDLSSDPWERRDLRGDAGRDLELRRLRRALQEVSGVLERRLDESSDELSEEDIDILRSLGYLGN